MALSNYTEAALLNALFGRTSDFGSLASAPTIYVALSTADPGSDGSSISEPSGDGYGRVSTASGDWGDASAGNPTTLSNSATITFPQATGSWGTVTYAAFFDASTGGEFLGSGALETSRAVESGDEPRFSTGELTVELREPA